MKRFSFQSPSSSAVLPAPLPDEPAVALSQQPQKGLEELVADLHPVLGRSFQQLVLVFEIDIEIVGAAVENGRVLHGFPVMGVVP